MSLSQHQHQPLSMRPLGQNNSQQPQPGGGKIKRSLASKITASADSTGLENDGPPLVKHHHSVKKQQTASVVKRNLRERTRVRGVNDGFGKLKMHVPDLKNKSSKVETLRGAIDYIRKLKELLGEEIEELSNSPSTPGGIKFEDDDGEVYNYQCDDNNRVISSDSSSSYSDLGDSPQLGYSPAIKTESSPEMVVHPMVYQLPCPDYYNIHLPPVSLSSLTPLPPGKTEKLPSMSISAPSWWPDK